MACESYIPGEAQRRLPEQIIMTRAGTEMLELVDVLSSTASRASFETDSKVSRAE